jgi:hypothetical protein
MGNVLSDIGLSITPPTHTTTPPTTPTETARPVLKVPQTPSPTRPRPPAVTVPQRGPVHALSSLLSPRLDSPTLLPEGTTPQTPNSDEGDILISSPTNHRLEELRALWRAKASSENDAKGNFVFPGRRSHHGTIRLSPLTPNDSLTKRRARTQVETEIEGLDWRRARSMSMPENFRRDDSQQRWGVRCYEAHMKKLDVIGMGVISCLVSSSGKSYALIRTIKRALGGQVLHGRVLTPLTNGQYEMSRPPQDRAIKRLNLALINSKRLDSPVAEISTLDRLSRPGHAHICRLHECAACQRYVL